MEYVLTEPGRQKIADYILQCAAKRKEILDAGIDTADATKLPTEKDILSDFRLQYQPNMKNRWSKDLP